MVPEIDAIVSVQHVRQAAEVLIAEGINRTPPTPLWEDPVVDVEHAVADVLGPFLNATDVLEQVQTDRTGRQSWVHLDGDRAAAMLSLTLRRVEPGDMEYAYLPPAYAALGMAGTLADSRADLPALRELFRHASAQIRAAGIDQVAVQVRTATG